MNSVLRIRRKTPNLSVADNVLLGLAGLRLPRPRARDRALDALKLRGIAELAGRRPGTISGGQQQRVALARALAVQPQLLLLDEPFGGLDLLTKQQIVGEIARLKAEFGFVVILVTHDPAEVRLLCNSLVVLEAGHIVDQGTLGQVASKPRSALAQVFISHF